jgi:TonB-dependent starch-binding outer membrane protein SusC
MKNSLFKCFQAFAVLLFVNVTFSQTVSGVVSDATGPLPGVSILIKGTTNGTQTNFDGSYSLKGLSPSSIIVFSYIGFKTQEIPVGTKKAMNVVMVEESNKLSEVVVIGYGTVKKKDATGAVDVISSKSFDNVSATTPAELLRGKVSGVQVTSTSGEPGAGLSIRIRGNSSIRSGNNPLIVIDGVPLDGGNTSAEGADIRDLGSSSARSPLNFINQNDIESMSILKDASSTAIYGSRGANGVIIITTKRGKSQKTELSYTTSLQFSRLSGNFDLLSSKQYGDAVASTDAINGPAAYNLAIANGDSPQVAAEAAAAARLDKGSRTYEWKDAILRSGFSNNHDLSFSKSSDNSSTRISFGATTTDGIVKNTGLDKYTASLFNSNEYFGGVLKIESRLLYATLKDEAAFITNNPGFIGNLIGSALYWNPTLSIYKPDGSYTFVGEEYLNPVQLLNSYNDYTNTQKLIGSINTTLKISNSLKYNFVFGVEQSNSNRKRQFLPTIRINSNDLKATDAANGGVQKFGFAQISGISKFNKTFEHNLTFNKDVSTNFNLNAVVGYSYYSYDYEGNVASGVGYDSKQTNLIDNIEGGVAVRNKVSSARNKVELQSLFGRAETTIFKKLILTGTLRRDGSSKLGVNNKYELFSSGGAAFKIVDDQNGIVNNLKIRGSYGKTGNQEFAPNSALSKQSYDAGGSNNNLEQVNANPDLRWETTKSYSIGLDFELFNNKVTGSVDYFNRDTKGLIFPLRPASTPLSPNSNRFINLDGNLINKGIEVALNYSIINSEKFSWNVSANAAFLSNKLENFPIDVNAGGVNGQGLSGAYAQVIKSGYPIYTYYLFEFIGYDAAGNSLYTDDNGNAVPAEFATAKYLDKQPLPKINAGFSTTLNYNGFDATASFYGAFGHYIYNNTANAYFVKSALFGGRNVTPAVAASAQNDIDPNSPSTKFLEKGDFIRLGNLTFGYTARGNFIERIKLKSARLFVNADNLFVITKYSGFDPEVDTDKTLANVPSAGMDFLSYPRSKGISVGLNVTF